MYCGYTLSFYKDLNRACLDGDLQKVHNLDERDAPGRAIQYAHVRACQQGNLDLVKVLYCLNARRKEASRASFQVADAFQAACEKNHVDVAMYLLKRHGSSGHRSSTGTGPYPWYIRATPFISACTYGHLDLVKECLRHPSDMDSFEDSRATAFMMAGRGGHIDILRFLLSTECTRSIDWSGPCVQSAFTSACTGNHGDTVQLLLDLDANSDLKPSVYNGKLFQTLCEHDCHLSVRALLTLRGERAVHVRADKEKAFRVACAANSVRVVEELLALEGDARIDVHVLAEDAFRGACKANALDVVRRLLQLTGDRQINVHRRNEDAFRQACRLGHVDVVRELLALTGPRQVNVHIHSENALLLACANGRTAVVKELLKLSGERQVDAHANSQGCFNAACRSGHAGVVRQLLKLQGDRAIDIFKNNNRAYTRAKSSSFGFYVLFAFLTVPKERLPPADMQADISDALVCWAPQFRDLGVTLPHIVMPIDTRKAVCKGRYKKLWSMRRDIVMRRLEQNSI